MFGQCANNFKRITTLILSIFIASVIVCDGLKLNLAYASVVGLPQPGTMVMRSDSYSMAVLKGLKIDIDNPFDLDFVIDSNNQKQVSKEEASKLINYFLAALTIEKENIWVNLSPYEQDRITDQNLAITDLGKDLLKQDYILKQISASLTAPETDTGKKYWSEFSNNDSRFSAQNTDLSKIWIVPEEAKIYEAENAAYITKMTFDVETQSEQNVSSSLTNILNEVRKEVNNGKNFANLRQIFHSIVLAEWFKAKLKDSFFKHYINQNKVAGIDLNDKTVKDKIWAQYVESFQKGAYNTIAKTKDSNTGRIQKQKFFAGGIGSSTLHVDNNDEKKYLVFVGDPFNVGISLTDIFGKLFDPRTPVEVNESLESESFLEYDDSDNKSAASSIEYRELLQLIANDQNATVEGFFDVLKNYCNEDKDFLRSSEFQNFISKLDVKNEYLAQIVQNVLVSKRANEKAFYEIFSWVRAEDLSSLFQFEDDIKRNRIISRFYDDKSTVALGQRYSQLLDEFAELSIVNAPKSKLETSERFYEQGALDTYSWKRNHERGIKNFARKTYNSESNPIKRVTWTFENEKTILGRLEANKRLVIEFQNTLHFSINMPIDSKKQYKKALKLAKINVKRLEARVDRIIESFWSDSQLFRAINEINSDLLKYWLTLRSKQNLLNLIVFSQTLFDNYQLDPKNLMLIEDLTYQMMQKEENQKQNMISNKTILADNMSIEQISHLNIHYQPLMVQWMSFEDEGSLLSIIEKLNERELADWDVTELQGITNMLKQKETKVISTSIKRGNANSRHVKKREDRYKPQNANRGQSPKRTRSEVEKLSVVLDDRDDIGKIIYYIRKLRDYEDKKKIMSRMTKAQAADIKKAKKICNNRIKNLQKITGIDENALTELKRKHGGIDAQALAIQTNALSSSVISFKAFDPVNFKGFSFIITKFIKSDAETILASI